MGSEGEKGDSIDQHQTIKVYIVTDPMCSWCWGMAGAVEEAAHRLADQVTFELLLGGINTHATQPIGEFGRRHLMKLWQEVRETTGQRFGFELPEGLIYNSHLPCVAIEARDRRRYSSGSSLRSRAASVRSSPCGMYPTRGSCADV